MIDLFRVTSAPAAELLESLSRVWTPDEQGRTYVGQGKLVDNFEAVFAQVTGLKCPPLGVNSCSAAIDLALHMIGAGPGDEVITSPITCSATNGPIVTRGASIVWADVDPVTGNIDPSSVEHMIGPRTKAIIAVDWGGRSCDYIQLKSTFLPVIQDAAHRLYVTEPHGDYVAWSFGPIKHLTTGGYGGALLPPVYEHDRARLLRWHGLDRVSKADFRCEQDIPEVGYRYHMTDDMAAVGLTNLPYAVDAVAKARENARWYSDVLADVPGITLPPFDPNSDYWLFTLLVDQRDELKSYLAQHGVASSQVHARNDKHSAYAAASVRQDRDLPGAESFDAHQLSIPCGHWVTDEDREHVAAIIAAFALQPVPV